MNIQSAVFVRSAADEKGFPHDSCKRVVFAGRSNVGKSSTINSIFSRKNFARVSSMPGKTVFVNLFRVEDKYWFVDLPGYGYAKTSKAEQERFAALIEQFFQQDLDKIARFYLIVDARHEPTVLDVQMVEWVRQFNLPLTVICNKTDKLKPREVEESLNRARQVLNLTESDHLIGFSAEKHTNRPELIRDIERALEG